MEEKAHKEQKDNMKIALVDKATFLGIEKSFIYLKKKSDRVSTAIYMVTSFFPETEILKSALRESAVSLIKDISDLGTATLSERELIRQDAGATVLEIGAFLEMANASGLISDSNCSILSDELALFMNRLNEQAMSEASLRGISLPQSFFDIQSTENQIPVSQTSFSESHSVNTPHSIQKDKIKDIDKGHSDPVFSKGSSNKSNRQETIIKALSKGDYMNIKDLLKMVKGCSEKTLQRELISMLSKGLIKRTGERRWSTYSLAK